VGVFVDRQQPAASQFRRSTLGQAAATAAAGVLQATRLPARLAQKGASICRQIWWCAACYSSTALLLLSPGGCGICCTIVLNPFVLSVLVMFVLHLGAGLQD
jgi:hypothetical protein